GEFTSSTVAVIRPASARSRMPCEVAGPMPKSSAVTIKERVAFTSSPFLVPSHRPCGGGFTLFPAPLRGRAYSISLPPCGGGLGWGVRPCNTLPPTPTLPRKGGGRIWRTSPVRGSEKSRGLARCRLGSFKRRLRRPPGLANSPQLANHSGHAAQARCARLVVIANADGHLGHRQPEVAARGQ